MKWISHASAYFAVLAASHAQPLDLRGRVVRAGGLSIPGAVVELKTKGVSTQSAADGSFTLNASSAVFHPGSGRDFEYRLLPGFLSVDSRIPLALRMEVFDMSGRRLGGLSRSLGKGMSRISVEEALAGRSMQPGMYVLRLHLGGQSLVHRVFHSGAKSPPCGYFRGAWGDSRRQAGRRRRHAPYPRP